MAVRSSLCALSMIGAASGEGYACSARAASGRSWPRSESAIRRGHKAATGTTVTSEFGPFGLLRERIEKSEHSALFASADMGHLLKLLRDDRSTRVPTVGDSSAALPYRPTGAPFGSAMASRPMEAAVTQRGHPHMNRHQVAHPSPRDVEGAVRRSGPLSRLELECRTWRSSESAYGTQLPTEDIHASVGDRG
jgi:hypothetical protein